MILAKHFITIGPVGPAIIFAIPFHVINVKIFKIVFKLQIITILLVFLSNKIYQYVYIRVLQVKNSVMLIEIYLYKSKIK